MFLQRALVLVYEILLYYNIILMLNTNIAWYKAFHSVFGYKHNLFKCSICIGIRWC